MQNLFLLFLLFTSGINLSAQDVWVDGYQRSNGTYVKGHYRTKPNHTKNDNFSTIGNVNPYTGQAGIKAGGFNNGKQIDYTNNNYSRNSSPVNFKSSNSFQSREFRNISTRNNSDIDVVELFLNIILWIVKIFMIIGALALLLQIILVIISPFL